MLVLVVDDEPAVCDTLRHRLQRDGHSVLVAFTPQAAVELAKDHYFHLAIIDLELGHVLTGVDVARHLPQSTAKVLYTGYDPKDVLPEVEDPMRVFWCVVQKGGDYGKDVAPIVERAQKMIEDTQP